MQINLIIPERLFDHQQVESVKLPKMFCLIKSVGAVGIDAEHDIRPASADFFEDIQVPSRLDLELYPTITGVQFCGDLVHQLFDRVLNANGNSAGNLALCSAE